MRYEKLDLLKDSFFEIAPEKSIPVRDLLDSWAAHVERLDNEKSWSLAESPSAWGAFDYHAALILRDSVEDCMETIEKRYLDVMQSDITPVDNKFLAFTRVDEKGDFKKFLARCDIEPSRSTGWWWQRIPKSGPALEEIRNFLGG